MIYTYTGVHASCLCTHAHPSEGDGGSTSLDDEEETTDFATAALSIAECGSGGFGLVFGLGCSLVNEGGVPLECNRLCE